MSTSSRPVRTAALVAVASAVLAAGCTPATSDGGQVVVTTDDRVEEVRDARAALAAPVPALLGEAGRLVEAVEEVWRLEDAADVRGRRASALQLAPLRTAAADLAAVELMGDGPDVTAARALLADLDSGTSALLRSAEEELATLSSLPAFDARLLDVLGTWDERGSFSQQLNAFEEAAATADGLAAEAAEQTPTPACTMVWERRGQAATTVAERTRELQLLVRNRRGQEFDELRDAYRQDPYALGARLGEADAAAAACWLDGSELPAMMADLEGLVDDLAAALDPADLQG